MNTTKASPLGTHRTNAAIVGVLFVLGTVPALLSLPLMLNTVSAVHRNQRQVERMDLA